MVISQVTKHVCDHVTLPLNAERDRIKMDRRPTQQVARMSTKLRLGWHMFLWSGRDIPGHDRPWA